MNRLRCQTLFLGRSQGSASARFPAALFLFALGDSSRCCGEEQGSGPPCLLRAFQCYRLFDQRALRGRKGHTEVVIFAFSRLFARLRHACALGLGKAGKATATYRHTILANSWLLSTPAPLEVSPRGITPWTSAS